MTQYGGTCVVSIITEGPYDLETSTVPIIRSDYTCKSIAFDYLQRMQGIGFETNTLVRSGDKQIFVKMVDGMPLPTPGTDSITYMGKKMNIVTVKDYNPSGNYSYVLEIFARE
jgi:hypothetical protein